MSRHFYRVKGYFDKDLWTLAMVQEAVVMEWITTDEYAEITGEEYDPETAAGTAANLAARVDALEALVVQIAEVEIGLGNMDADSIEDSSIRDTVKADLDGGTLEKDLNP